PCNPWPNGLRADRSQPAADVPTWAADRPEEPHHRSGPPTFSARAGRACAAPSGRHVPPGEAERRVLPARRGGVYTPTGPSGPARTAPAPPANGRAYRQSPQAGIRTRPGSLLGGEPGLEVRDVPCLCLSADGREPPVDDQHRQSPQEAPQTEGVHGPALTQHRVREEAQAGTHSPGSTAVPAYEAHRRVPRTRQRIERRGAHGSGTLVGKSAPARARAAGVRAIDGAGCVPRQRAEAACVPFSCDDRGMSV